MNSNDTTGKVLPPVGAPTPASILTVNDASTSPAAAKPDDSTQSMRDMTAADRDPLTELLALIPVDKQAQAYKHIEKMLQSARDTGAPYDASKSNLSLSKGKRYRKSERAPFGAKMSDDGKAPRG